MQPQRIPGLAVELNEVRRDVARRHDENEARFDNLETSLAAAVATLKLVVMLLVANAGLLVWVGTARP